MDEERLRNMYALAAQQNQAAGLGGMANWTSARMEASLAPSRPDDPKENKTLLLLDPGE